MPCYSPRKAWLSGPSGSEGVGRPSFDEKRGFDFPITLSCGSCIGCRVRKQVAWGTRIYCESRLHLFSSFATFTYDDEHLPSDGGLHYEDMQRFFKRLRLEVAPSRIRFFCGCEYGGRYGRPHYHVVFLGWVPDEEAIFRRAGTAAAVISPFLERLWGMGGVRATLLEPAQCLYVAKHNVDKLTGAQADREGTYRRVDRDTGEIVEVRAPFATMSRRPGIGHAWVERYLDDVSKIFHDGVVVEGKLRQLPRYFDDFIASVKPRFAAEREDLRIIQSLDPRRVADSTPERLAVREVVARAGIARAREGRQL